MKPFRPISAALIAGLLAAGLAGCSSMATVDHHGHQFTDTDLGQIQTGMSKDQVRLSLGSPDTTATAGGNAFYYISSTQRSIAFTKPSETDRQVVAVFFDNNDLVTKVGRYGLKEGNVVDYASGKTPSRGKELTLLEQMFGNLGARRKEAIDQNKAIGPGSPF